MKLLFRLAKTRVWRICERRMRLMHERLDGVDFSGLVNPDEVGLDASVARRSSTSGDLFLNYVLKELSIGEDDSIVDIGCGKGSAIRIMLRFPFRRADGVELSDTIASVARKNFQRLGVPATRCRIITSDASLFQDLDDYNHVYMFNPFSSQVMAKFVDNLTRSIRRTPRRLKIIYCNPE